MKRNHLFIALTVLTIAVSVIAGDWVVRGQTPENQNQSPSANPQTTGVKQKNRSKSRRSRNANASPAQTNAPDMTNTSGVPPEAGPQPIQTTQDTPTRRARGRRHSTKSSSTQSTATAEQTDLSGTYAGVLNCPDAGVTGDTTLTITGNQFSLADGKTGRIVAATTRGYTAVAMQFGEFSGTGQATAQMPATPPTVVSFRARKSGDRLVLSAVPGGRQCSFMPSGATARTRRGRRNRPEATVPTAQETANPAEATPAMQPATTTRGKKRRASRANQNQNANMDTNANTNENMNSNENTGAGNANANPTPSPTPGPR